MAADLTTVANVKAQAGTLGAAADTVLGSIITQASAFIVKLTERSFGETPIFNEVRDGSGGSELLLGHTPVVSITALTVDAIPIPAQPADPQPGYFIVDNQLLVLEGYKFTRGRKNVRLSGTAGYAVTPKEIEQACIEMVVSAYKRVSRGVDMRSENVPANGMNISWDLSDIPAYAKRAINAYRKAAPV